MSLADELKLALDSVRAIPGILGLRPYTVSVRVRSWSGSRAGLGTATDVDSQLLVGGLPPDVRQLTQRDVIASGGLYSTQDYEVTLTPDFTSGDLTGGISASVLDPDVGSHPQEIFFQLTGPGSPGSFYKKVGQDISNILTYKITLRKTGEIG